VLLPGPSGCFQHAPWVHFHHCEKALRLTASDGGEKTSEPGTSFSAGGELPLGLGRQSLAGPFGVSGGVVPGDVDDGVVVLAF